jgi:glucose/arabinose dehydrogenase
MDPNTGDTTLYAEGIRNTVGMAWHPQSKELYFTDNGRDMLGEDVPQEEVNKVSKPGSHYGYPYIHAGEIADPKFGKGHKSEDYEPPLLKIQAHSAALGIAFYDHTEGDHTNGNHTNGFPERYKNALFIAEHGSWNRKKKVGYRVSVMFETPQGPQYAPFITGWLNGQANWGRPNDVLITPKGDLLISDDQTGSIYRVSYESFSSIPKTVSGP